MIDPKKKKRRYQLGLVVALSLAIVACWVQFATTPHSDVVRQSKRADLSDNNVRLVQGGRGPAFDMRGLTVPAAEVRSGGPPKDGIPALTNPKLTELADAIYLRDTTVDVPSETRQ